MAERQPDDDPRLWDDAQLVLAVRREEPRAFAELYDRFAPRLARLARAWRVPAGEREPLAAEVIGDVALTLVRHATAPPRSLAAYLATALRHRVAADARERARRARLAGTVDETTGNEHLAPPSRDSEIIGDLALLLTSQHARRAADPGWTTASPDPAIVRLTEHLVADLAADDRRLLLWLAHDVPLRTAADWLGLRYDTAVKRAQRLRGRLRTRADRYAEALAPGPERRAVHAFLRRAAAPTQPAGEPATRSQEIER